jgi:hypothetical protein
MIQTTSPEIGQELEKALISAGYETGICNHRHISQIGVTCTRLEFKHIFKREYNTNKYFDEFTAVFTMCELWEMLPEQVNVSMLRIIKYPYVVMAVYEDTLRSSSLDKKPCNALAKLAIWCIQNNHELKLAKT